MNQKRVKYKGEGEILFLHTSPKINEQFKKDEIKLVGEDVAEVLLRNPDFEEVKGRDK